MEEKDIKQENHINNSNRNKIMIIVGIILILVIVILALIMFNKEKPRYNITFETNGGSVIDSIIVNENEIITKPENPTKENYKFVGWYYNNELYDFSKPVICDMKLEARWNKIQNILNVVLDKQEITLNTGDVSKLTIIATPEDIEKESIIWESSDPEIAKVDSEGNITALKEGTVTITVSSNNGKYVSKAQITVIAKDTIETSTNITDSVVNKNEKPSNKPNSSVTLKPSINNNESIYIPDNTTGNDEPGDETENNKDNTTKEENTTINVTGVTLNVSELILTEGDSAKLIATVNPSNADNKNVTWSSSNSNIVSVDSNGNVKALKEGTATIIVTTKDGGHIAKAQISVKRKYISVTGVSLNNSTLNLTEGDSQKLTATVNPSIADNKNVTWVSTNPNIVSVDSNGNVKALKPGSATITVITNDGNYKATCQITVKEKAPSYSVIVTPIVQAGTGAIFQYSVEVTQNNNSFNEWKFINYNGTIVKKTLSSAKYTKDITSATIRLNDGTEVKATVLYK